MEFVPFVWGVIAATFVVTMVFLIRAMMEIRRTMVGFRDLINRLDADLRPVLRESHDILADLKVTTNGIASRVEDVKSAMTAIGDTGRNISRVNLALGEVADVVSRVSLLSTGIKAAGKYAVNRIIQRRG